MMYNEPRGFLSSGHSGERGKKHSKREKKNIPKNVRSKIFIKLFVPRYLSNFLDFSITFLNVFGALRARSLVPIQLRQQVKRTLRSSATPQEVCVDDGLRFGLWELFEPERQCFCVDRWFDQDGNRIKHAFASP